MKKIKIVLLLLFISSTSLMAQSNLGCPWDAMMAQMLCGSWSIQGDDVNLCNDGVKVWLQYLPGAVPYNDSLVQAAFGSTDSYAVAVKPYAWETIAAPQSPSNFNVDDDMSNAIKLPFSFCFYGNKYDSIVIGSNGRISFNAALAGTTDDYVLTNYGPIPYNDPYYTNAIFSPYHDIDVSVPGANGTIEYGIVGTAPCRKFVITWKDAPMFSCNNLIANQQIVLHEQSFQIDVNVQDKFICAGWEDGLAFLGIQGNNTSQYAQITAYNSLTPWTATNLSVRFQPIGKKNTIATTSPSNLQVYWIDSFTNNVIGVGDTLVYFPTQDTTIYVFIGDTNLLNNPQFIAGNDSLNTCGKGLSCANFTPYKRLTVITTIADFSHTQTADCQGQTITFTNNSTNATSYLWIFGDGNTSTQVSPSHYYYGTTPIQVKLVAIGPNCTDTSVVNITPIFKPVKSIFNLSSLSFCSNVPLVGISTSTGTPPLSYIWTMGDGSSYVTSNVNHSYTSGGPKAVQLVVLDAAGCPDSSSQTVNVEMLQVFNAIATPNNVCINQSISLQGSNTTSLQSVNWNLGDGVIINGPNPLSYSYGTKGTYTITAVADYAICPNQTSTLIVLVDSFPVVDLGGTERICAGKETKIIIDSNNPGATYVWSTGAVGTNSISIAAPGNYSINVSNGNCTTTDTKEFLLDLDCINIMNAFTPNGDKLNDHFLPIWYDPNYIGDYQVRIFNRWGEEVYNSDNKFDLGWDGNYKERPCEMGNYVYMLTIKDKLGNARKAQGDLFLMR